MSRHRRRTASGAVSVLVLSGALGGCSAGFDAVTSQPYAAADGVLAIEGPLRVSNVLVIGDEAGSGRVLLYATSSGEGSVLEPNEGDELVSVSVEGAGAVEIVGGSQVPVRGALAFQDAEDDGGIVVTGMTKVPGEAVTVEMIFREAGSLEVVTTVVPPTGYYEGYLDGIGAEAEEPGLPAPTGAPGGVFPGEGATPVEPPATTASPAPVEPLAPAEPPTPVETPAPVEPSTP